MHVLIHVFIMYACMYVCTPMLHYMQYIVMNIRVHIDVRQVLYTYIHAYNKNCTYSPPVVCERNMGGSQEKCADICHVAQVTDVSTLHVAQVTDVSTVSD